MKLVLSLMVVSVLTGCADDSDKKGANPVSPVLTESQPEPVMPTVERVDETQSPILENELYKLEKGIYSAGETVRLIPSAEAPLPIYIVARSLKYPNSLVSSPGKPEDRGIFVPEFMPDGMYEISLIQTSVSPFHSFSSDRALGIYERTKLKVLRFRIENSGPVDTAKPEITNVATDRREISKGDTLSVEFDIKDDLSGVTSKLVIVSFKGLIDTSRNFYFDSVEGSRRVFTINREDLDLPSGSYETSLTIHDNVGNTLHHPGPTIKILP